MTGPEMLDKLRVMCNLVENAPEGVDFTSEEILDGKFKQLPIVHVNRGIELFREPVGFLYSTEMFNWFGFVSEGILVCQAFDRDGGGTNAQTP